jgi:hypothetical protein
VSWGWLVGMVGLVGGWFVEMCVCVFKLLLCIFIHIPTLTPTHPPHTGCAPARTFCGPARCCRRWSWWWPRRARPPRVRLFVCYVRTHVFLLLLNGSEDNHKKPPPPLYPHPSSINHSTYTCFMMYKPHPPFNHTALHQHTHPNPLPHSLGGGQRGGVERGGRGAGAAGAGGGVARPGAQ